MLVATFPGEKETYKGLDALKDLNEKGDITLYAAAVLKKDASGKVDVKEAFDEGPVNTAFGTLTGALMGSLGGIPGAAMGIALGSMTGLLFDIGDSGVNVDFLNDISEVLIPGKVVLLAEIDEDWVTPVDTQLGMLGGEIFRRPRYEVVEDQLTRESEAFSKEMEELRQELSVAKSETKATLHKTQQSLVKRLEVVRANAEAKLNQVNDEAEAKVQAVQAQLKKAGEEQKAKLENRIADIKADQKMRSEKLQKARKLAREALTL